MRDGGCESSHTNLGHEAGKDGGEHAVRWKVLVSKGNRLTFTHLFASWYGKENTRTSGMDGTVGGGRG